MYDSLSKQTKYLFNYPVFSRKPTNINPVLWILGKIALLISLSPLRKILWKLFPKACYFIVGAFVSGELVGVCFLFKFSKSNRKVIAKNFGIAVKDKFQGKGIGSKLLEYLFSVAVESYNVSEVYLEVLENNERALKFYKKNSFEILCDVKKPDGKTYKFMKRVLSKGN
ncbi:MAG: GNAT family N-acetyltransferase [Candidatus Methanospirare jalkutatii]|nr:GNAT family N-acetyltransferase [Candidatus Methanospirare jalkutatii]